MTQFDFITNESFRDSLQKDYLELESAITNKMWKSSHLLGGSIVESLLTDALLLTGESESELLNLELGPLIDRATSRNIISPKIKELCTVLKSYRNLIHPGRQIRLGESIDEDNSVIVFRLAKLVVTDVRKFYNSRLGYTALQIIEKIRLDDSTLYILQDLLKDFQQSEILKLVPDWLIKIEGQWSDDDGKFPYNKRVVMKELISIITEKADKTTGKGIGERIAKLVKESNQQDIDTFFRNYVRSIKCFSDFEKQDTDVIINYALGHFEDRARIYLPGHWASYMSPKNRIDVMKSIVQSTDMSKNDAKFKGLVNTLRAEIVLGDSVFKQNIVTGIGQGIKEMESYSDLFYSKEDIDKIRELEYLAKEMPSK